MRGAVIINIDAVLPLKPLQRSMMCRYCSNESSTEYHELYVYNINGKIDLSTIKETIHYIDRNRDAMRSVFLWKNTNYPLQVIRQHKQTKFTTLDTSRLLDDWIKEIWKKQLDLSNAPYEVYWYSINMNQSYLLVKTHHILMDGWSQSIWANEFLNTYETLLEGNYPQFVSIKYQEYIENYINNSQKNKSFWQGKLLEFPKLSQYSIMKPDPKIITMEFKGLFNKITNYSKNAAVSFSSYIYTAWAIFLAIQENNNHVAFYITLSGRENIPAVYADMIGMFINVIPVSIILESKALVTQIMKTVHQECLDGMFHQEVDIMELMLELPREYELQIGSTIDLQTYPLFTKRKNNIFTMEVCNHLFECHNDLLLAVRNADDDLLLELVYNRNKFGDTYGEFTSQLIGEILEKMLYPDITYDSILQNGR